MIRRFRNRYLFACDIVLISAAVYMSLVLRLEQYDLREYWQGFFAFTLVVVLFTTILFAITGLYSRYWPYASIEELGLICGICILSTVIASITALFLYKFDNDLIFLPSSVPFIFLLLALAATLVPRYALRLAAHCLHWFSRTQGSIPTLIVGAGETGALILRELQYQRPSHAQVFAFVDESRRKQGTYIHGVPVLGGYDDIAGLVTAFGVQQVIIALPDAPGKTISEIVCVSEKLGAKTRIMPAIYQLLDGKATVNQLREVQVEDLLRRESVQTDVAEVRTLIAGRRVLVTGE